MSNTPWYSEGLKFTCTRCSRCCRHESGYVFLSKTDLSRLSRHFSMDNKSFLKKYCKSVDLGLATRTSLKEQENFDCIFWKNGGCTVYEARPLQCRSFPFWPQNLDSRDSWNRVGDDCPGINVGEKHDSEKIDNFLVERRNHPFV